MSEKLLLDAVARNPQVAAVVEATPDLGLPDCYVAAGCLAQTVWNLAAGRDPATDLKDIDLVYFDPDLSEAAERRHRRRVERRFRHLPLALDVKNEARVHLWYRQRFGYAIEPYPSTERAIASFPTTATALGVRRRGAGFDVCAPFGLHDLFSLVVRPNKRQVTRAIYQAKIVRWARVWPDLTIVPWEDEAPPEP